MGSCPPILHGCGDESLDGLQGVDVSDAGINSTVDQMLTPDIGSLRITQNRLTESPTRNLFRSPKKSTHKARESLPGKTMKKVGREGIEIKGEKRPTPNVGRRDSDRPDGRARGRQSKTQALKKCPK
jgi:hypothetical protein